MAQRAPKPGLPFFLVVFLGVSVTVWAEEKLPPLPQGPLLLTSVQPAQLNPEYWINQLHDPDKILKTPAEIQTFNKDIHLALSNCIDVFRMDLFKPGKPVRDQIELEYNAVSKRMLWDVEDKRVPKDLFEKEIKPAVAMEAVPKKIKIRWAVATRQTSVRALPSDVKMLEKPGDWEFDQLQFSQIKLWTPAAIYHESADGEWYYIQAPYIRGWVHARDMAIFSSRDEIKNLLKAGPFLVVTGESVPLYADSGLSRLLLRPSMGTQIPLAETKAISNRYAVWRPVRGAKGKALLEKAYVNIKSNVSRGFLSLTQANVIRQAFKLLGARYGWGGAYNGRDCSGFTHDVFLTFGIDMPRGSKEQAFVGVQINHFEYKEGEADKLRALRSATPGITLLRMPRHQMLYLGEMNGKFYVIHCTWAERVGTDPREDAKRRINQVVVSDLSLNGNSYLGALFDRIISISEIID